MSAAQADTATSQHHRPLGLAKPGDDVGGGLVDVGCAPRLVEFTREDVEAMIAAGAAGRTGGDAAHG